MSVRGACAGATEGSGLQVVGAKIQQITMEEFLPAIGITHMDVRKPPQKRFGSQITIEFATAVYRMGHGTPPASAAPL